MTKVWDDSSDQDGKRASYGVTMYADGTAVG
ncbi:MAG: Cna B-type domain-containing protein, partial [Acetatifactor sp.]|nr:Cna B-type domain-containing protein [Acetatifactor sp.]